MESPSMRSTWRERLTYIGCIERWHHTLGILLMYNKYFSLKIFEAMGSLPYSEPLLSTKTARSRSRPLLSICFFARLQMWESTIRML
jgi:hypothetical protein